MRFRLLHQSTAVELAPGVAVIGRSTGCKVRLEGEDVSRRHARITIDATSAVLEDLGSANGVLVNGEGLTAPRALRDGDRIGVAQHELRVAVDAEGVTSSEPRSRSPLDDLWDDDEQEDFDDGGATVIGVDLEAVCATALRLLAEGKVEAAEAILPGQLERALGSADLGELGREACTEAARCALRLAQAARQARWLDHAVQLHAAAGWPFDADLYADLDGAIERLGAEANPWLETCLAALRARPQVPAALIAQLERRRCAD